MEPLGNPITPDDGDLDRGATAADEIGQVLLAEELQVLLDAEAWAADGQLAFERPRCHVASASRGRRPLRQRPEAAHRAGPAALGRQ
jgi:hypothetical protein